MCANIFARMRLVRKSLLIRRNTNKQQLQPKCPEIGRTHILFPLSSLSPLSSPPMGNLMQLMMVQIAMLDQDIARTKRCDDDDDGFRFCLFYIHISCVCVCVRGLSSPVWMVSQRSFLADVVILTVQMNTRCVCGTTKRKLSILFYICDMRFVHMLSIGLIPHGYAFCLLDVTSSACDWGEQKMSRTSLLCAKIHWPHRDEPKTDRQGFVEPAESFLFVFFLLAQCGCVCVSVWIVCVSLVNDQPQYIRQSNICSSEELQRRQSHSPSNTRYTSFGEANILVYKVFDWMDYGNIFTAPQKYFRNEQTWIEWLYKLISFEFECISIILPTNICFRFISKRSGIFTFIKFIFLLTLNGVWLKIKTTSGSIL